MERDSCHGVRGQRQGELALSAPVASYPLTRLTQADQDSSSSNDLTSRTLAHLRENHVPQVVETDDRDEVSGPLRSARGTVGLDMDDAYEEEIKEHEGAWTHKVRRERVEQAKVRCRDVIIMFLHSCSFAVVLPTCLISPTRVVFQVKTAGRRRFPYSPVYSQ